MAHPGARSADRVVELSPDPVRVPRHRVAADHPGRAPGVGPAGREQAPDPDLVLGQEPGPDGSIQAMRGAASIEDRDGVVDVTRDRGASAPRRTHDETVKAPVSADDAGGRAVREGAEQVTAVLAGGLRVERDHVIQVVVLERADAWIGRRLRWQPGRLEDPVPRLDLEPEPLVHRPAGVRRDEDEGPATGVVRGIDRGTGQLQADPASPPDGIDEDRADPADGAVQAHDGGPDHRALGVGDEGTHLRLADDELEVEPAVAPVVAGATRPSPWQSATGRSAGAWAGGR